MNDLIRDLGLPKDGAEHLASALKEKGNLAKGTKSNVYLNREQDFRKYFYFDQELSLFYCTNVNGLINEIKPGVYKDGEWRVFIESSKRSLKAILLHNTNEYASIPIAHTAKLNENYSDMKIVLEKIKYEQNKLQICENCKLTNEGTG